MVRYIPQLWLSEENAGQTQVDQPLQPATTRKGVAQAISSSSGASFSSANLFLVLLMSGIPSLMCKIISIASSLNRPSKIVSQVGKY